MQTTRLYLLYEHMPKSVVQPIYIIISKKVLADKHYRHLSEIYVELDYPTSVKRRHCLCCCSFVRSTNRKIARLIHNPHTGYKMIIYSSRVLLSVFLGLIRYIFHALSPTGYTNRVVFITHFFSVWVLSYPGPVLVFI